MFFLYIIHNISSQININVTAQANEALTGEKVGVKNES